MKDAIFSGADVAAALAAASRDLGIPTEALRYVVLEAGGGETSARIAVLLEVSRGVAAERRAAARPHARGDETAAALVRELVRAAELDVEVTVTAGDEEITVRIDGPDRDFFTADDGAVLRALEHVLRRAVPMRQEARRVALELPGYRSRRDEELRERALRLARAVLEDGEPRQTDPLNSYERRIVHLAVAELAGLRSESVGAAAERRVTIQRTGAAPAE